MRAPAGGRKRGAKERIARRSPEKKGRKPHHRLAEEKKGGKGSGIRSSEGGRKKKKERRLCGSPKKEWVCNMFIGGEKRGEKARPARHGSNFK